MMTSDGQRAGDGSWELNIYVTDLEVERTLRVTGDLHIGGVMLKLVDQLDIAINWSDHGLWWPERNVWLARTRSTLDQCGVQADAKLLFTPMHKTLNVQLPDLNEMAMRVSFSDNVFSVVIKLCREFKIRHPEELSLARRLDSKELKKNQGVSATRRPTRASGYNSPNGHHHLSNNSLDNSHLNSPSKSPYTPATPQGTLLRNSNGGTSPHPYSPYGTLGGSHSPNSPYSFNANGTVSPASMNSLAFDGAMDSMLANSPPPTKKAVQMLYRPKNHAEKARINAGWLDSSRSLMEQGLRDNDAALLRFKFYNFYDLNPKYDKIRINQIFEQAKWALLSEELDCTDEEMMMFAALQLQAQIQSGEPQPDLDTSQQNGEDDVDAALTDLQMSLEGSSISTPGDITHIPELQDYLKLYKPKKISLKNYKELYFRFKDTTLTVFKSQKETEESPILRVSLRGCEVFPDVNISSQKYNIKLFVPSSEGLVEHWIKAETESQYAKWMAAFRLASKGKTMADSSYESEVQSILAFLSMQHPSNAPVLDSSQVSIAPEDFVAPRYLKKLKSRQIASRILEAHANVKDMNLIESKMNYIRAWQALPEYGVHYFIVKLKGSKKEELLGIAFNRMIRMDLNSGDSIKTWRFANIETWSVNWEIKQVQVAFDKEQLAFQCLTADCKVVHEFIGGYMFLAMRSGDKSQTLNQEMFHKLTGGRD